ARRHRSHALDPVAPLPAQIARRGLAISSCDEAARAPLCAASQAPGVPARAQDAAAVGESPRQRLDPRCHGDGGEGTVPGPELIPFELNSPLWTDAADKQRFMVLPPGTSITIGAEGELVFPLGTILLKEFGSQRFDGAGWQSRRVETRVMVLREN